MKKILFVIDSLGFGGIERTAISWLKFLSELKTVEVTLLITRKEGVFLKEIPSNINVISFDKSTQKRLEPFREAVKNNIKKLNFKYFYALFKDIIEVKKNSKYNLMELGEKLRYKIIMKETKRIEEKFDVAIAYSDHAPMYYVANKIEANKKILWIHADYDLINRNLKEIIEEYNSFDKIVCVSKKVMEGFIKNCKSIEKEVYVLNNILDETKINQLKNEPIKQFNVKDVNILSVARLSKEKNFETLIRAFNMMEQETKLKSKLYIIGDGEEKRKLKRLIRNLKLQNKVILLGGKENPYPYIANCDIYIQPSKYEGFSTTVNEAKYLKRPIIVTNVGGMQELIDNNITGIILKNDNQREIAKNLQYLILNPQRREFFTKNLNNMYNSNELRKKFLEILEIGE